MATAHAVERQSMPTTTVLFTDNVHPDDHTQPTYEMTPGLKPFTNQHLIDYELTIHILFITDSWVN